MKLIIALLFGLLISPSTYSGEYIGVFHPYWYNSSLYIKPMGATKTNIPDCVKRQLLRLYDTDISSDIFKHKYSMLLATWLAQKKIRVIGTGRCTAEGDEIVRIINYPL
ncbi:hypothetical protein [Shewanella woodyi]|uniref:hypothetical protein n=1 Tax=Shewanella woodyi TaxID=60961 RepID=UPI0007EA9817|nr:hypothetical protein [Shewanella woodyi]